MTNSERHSKGSNISFKVLLLFIGLGLTTSLFSKEGMESEKLFDSSLAANGGTHKVSTNAFILELLDSTHTAVALNPIDEPDFDFTTGEWLNRRNQNNYYHLGDITLRVNISGDDEWIDYSSASNRAPVKVLEPDSENVLSVTDMKDLFPDDVPFRVLRYWEKQGDCLVLRFELENIRDEKVEIGGLGIPLIFNNILHEKHLDEVHVENVFFDPYIGMDAGYLQVIRLSGEGSVLLVVPHQKSGFEAYRPLLDDPMPRGITFEGFHEWMIHSKAYAEQEWADAEQWNEPTSAILEPGEKYSFGLEFLLAENIQKIEETLLKHNRPVAVGIPGYVLPKDVKARLFIKHNSNISSIEVSPQDVLSFSEGEITKNGWHTYEVGGNQWGRARMIITYSDGRQQSINYKVIKSETEVVADNGRFLTTEQWFDDENDLFNRGPSVITYDYEKREKVTEDGRAWIAGLSDEGGAGAWLNAIMKQLIQPKPDEVRKLENFVNQTMWGGIQYSEGERKYGVRKSLFFYEPDSMPEGIYSEDINYNTWAAWNKEHAESTVRSYNYPHVTAAHWVMYRLARNYEGLVVQNPWDWYLRNAFHTAIAMVEQAPYYAQFGQMEGTIFLLVLDDLQREGWTDLADDLEKVMRSRADHWRSMNYPFGSEMPWDSTGQEEVYMWSKYFGFDEKAQVTLNAILAYMATVRHWGYNGSARRYWDFLYAGKLSRIERQLHHYGSALNSIPVLDAYKENPDNLYLLRVGYGGVMGALANITREGFAPCAFHSFPSTLEIDGISGDYGPGFFGYAVNSGTYLIEDEEFGWLSFGGNHTINDDWIKVEMTTSAKSRVFISSAGLQLSLDAGQFKSVSYNVNTREIRAELDRRKPYNNVALLRLSAYGEGSFAVNEFKTNERGLIEIPLKKRERVIQIQKL